MKKENGKKVISMFLILTMILGLTDFMSSEKKVSADSSVLTVGDSVYFGSYYQDKVTDKKLIEYIDEQNKDGGNKIDIDGIDFIKTRGNWFSEEQIEWQILADEGNNYLLLSKKVLFFEPYIKSPAADMSWEKSDIREILNEGVYNYCFTAKEKENIVTTINSTYCYPYDYAYVNKKDPYYEKTEDKVFLLSQEDLQNVNYGFESTTNISATRVAYSTQYASNENNAKTWWLRGDCRWNYGNLQGKYINASGAFSNWYVTYSYGIRPAIRVRKEAVVTMRTNLMNKIVKKINGTFTLGKDNNSFRHSDAIIDSTSGFLGVKNYKMDTEYFDKLVKYSSAGEKSDLKARMNYGNAYAADSLRRLEYYLSNDNSFWNGSCYGIASSMGMLYNKLIKISDLTTSNCNDYYSIPKPCEDKKKFLNSIQYLQLAQFLDRGGKTSAAISSTTSSNFLKINGSGQDDISTFLKKMVETVQSQGVTLFGFSTEKSGHAVLLTDCEYESTQDIYRIEVYDENTVGENSTKGKFSWMYVLGDFSSFGWEADGLNMGTYKSMYVLDWNRMKQLDGSTTAINKQGNYGIANSTSTIEVSLENPFIIKNVKGELLIYDGQCLSGSMKVYSCDINSNINAEGKNILKCSLLVDDSTTYEVSNIDKGTSITIFDDENYTSITATNLENIRINMESGITISDNENYEFIATISSEETVDENEKNLISVSASTVGQTTILKNKEKIDVDNKNGMKNVTESNYVGVERATVTHNNKLTKLSIGNIYKKHIHNYKVTSIKKATKSVNGTIKQQCTICGCTNNDTIARIGSVSISNEVYTYNGRAKKPFIIIKDSLGKVISSNNYTISYTNNVNVGKGTVKVNLKGNYNGTLAKVFKINPKSTSIKGKIKAKKNTIIIKWKKIPKQISGYEIQYSTNNKFTKKKKKTTKFSKKTLIIAKLNSRKKYYVRIRTYKNVGGTKYYSVWSKTKSVKTK